MATTKVQRAILEKLEAGPAQGVYGRSAYPKGMNGHCLQALASLGYVSQRAGESGREWIITEAGRAALVSP